MPIDMNKKVNKIKVGSFTIGSGDSKLTFTNITRQNIRGMPTIYTVTAKRGNNILHRALNIYAKNKQELRKGLGRMYPKNVREMHARIYGKKK